MEPAIDLAPTDQLIEKYRQKKGALIPLLQAIQGAYGYVPRAAAELVAAALKVSLTEVYGVLTFYTQFHLAPRGRHIIRVCQGTACHVMGSKDIVDYLSRKLGVKDGETTADGNFTLERVACLGCCGMAPVMAVDEDFHGQFTVQELDAILKKYTEA